MQLVVAEVGVVRAERARVPFKSEACLDRLVCTRVQCAKFRRGHAGTAEAGIGGIS